MEYILNTSELKKTQAILDAIAIITNKTKTPNQKFLSETYGCIVSPASLSNYLQVGLYQNELNFNLVMLEYLFRYDTNKAKAYVEKYNIDKNTRISNSELSLITRLPASYLAEMEYAKDRKIKKVFYNLIKAQAKESLYYQFKFLYTCVLDTYFVYDKLVEKYADENEQK